LAWNLLEAADIALAAGRQDEAAKLLGETARLGADIDAKDADGCVRGRCLARLGRLAHARKDAQGALALIQEAIGLCEAADDESELVRLYGNFAVLAHDLGREDPAPLFERAIGLARSLGDKLGEAKQLANLGNIHLARTERDLARACFESSYKLAQMLDWKEGVAVNANTLQRLSGSAPTNP
jgi:tetratricopeptide (TPR) repeat protein